MTFFNTIIKLLNIKCFLKPFTKSACLSAGVLGLGKMWAGEGAGVLVLRSLRGALGFDCLPAWGALARGGAPVIALRVGVRRPGLGDRLLSLLAYLCWGGGGLRQGWDRRFCLGVSSTYASLRTVTCREHPCEVWFSCLRPSGGGLVLPLWTRAPYSHRAVSLGG